jgi:hypothetical protein
LSQTIEGLDVALIFSQDKIMLRAAFGLIIALMCLCGAADAAERRIALVIGNSAYKYAGKLPNPVNDATDVAYALQRLGFQVTLDKDLEWEGLAREVDTFLNYARGADVAIFFYAGHGLQHDGGAFVLPIDARLENEFSVKRETFSIQDIVTQLGNSTHASIVLLDACRNNPLADRLRTAAYTGNRALNVGRGLGRIDVGGNSLVVYSAAPGQEARDGLGRNSPFTEALLKHIETPGLEVEQMLKRVTAEVAKTTGGKQQPERLSQLKIEVTLRPALADYRPAFSTPPATQPAPQHAPPPAVAAGKSQEEMRNEVLMHLHDQLGTQEKAKLEMAPQEELRREEEERKRRREEALKRAEELALKHISAIERNQKNPDAQTEEPNSDKQEVNVNKLNIGSGQDAGTQEKPSEQEKAPKKKVTELATEPSTVEEKIPSERPRHHYTRRRPPEIVRRHSRNSAPHRRHYYPSGGGGGGGGSSARIAPPP